MWLDNKKYDWKFNFLVDLIPDFKNIPQPLIWLWAEHHIQTPSPQNYQIRRRTIKISHVDR